MKHKIKNFLSYLSHINEAFPVGHFYSPIPNKHDIFLYENYRSKNDIALPDINLNQEKQLKLLKEYSQFYQQLPFPIKKKKGYRYYYENDWYSYTDAIFLFSFLRKNEPKRIIEVGSGFSSAVMLDTIDNCFTQRPDITFIEPSPERLKYLLTDRDGDQTRIIEKKLQEISHDLFLSLEAGDLLFVDSSHVVKCGSDLQRLFFDILPHISPGVFVHFHDVFYPFDYPIAWLKSGRYWNENYFLRAFLSYNNEWDIYFFNNYVTLKFSDFIKDKMPLCSKMRGGSLYIQRKGRS